MVPKFHDSKGALLDRCGGYELVRWNSSRYVERMEELLERKMPSRPCG